MFIPHITTITPLVCLDCIAGSKAYGLATATSDDDYKGVYLAPLPLVLMGTTPAVVQDEKHDRQYTELGIFCRELMLNNSGALELLACMGGEQELSCKPWMREFFAGRQFLSRRCYGTYIQNARTQLKRVRATHEKAENPPPATPDPLHYASILCREQTTTLADWLHTHGLQENQVALARVLSAPSVYALYRQATAHGLFGRDRTGPIDVRPMPESEFLGYVYYNAEGFSAQLRRCAQYREWLQKRNPARLVTAASLPPGQGQYDTKHMGHVFRLLHTAREIALEGRIHVRRTWDNAFLREVRAGRIPLQELLQQAEALIDELYTASTNTPTYHRNHR